MNAETKRKIQLAIEAGRAPVRAKGGSLLLRFGGRGFRYLVKDGEATEAGRFWSEKSGQALPDEGFDHTQQPVRRGRSEYIQMLNGEERLVRTWDAVRDKYKYTKTGSKFYKNAKSQFLVQIPVVIKGKRNDRSEYTIEASMPAQALGASAIFADTTLTDAQRRAKIKSDVLQEFQNRYEDGRLILTEFSDEITYLDNTREWTISELRTSAGGEDTRAILDRPLARRKDIAPLVPCVYDLLDEALEFRDDHLCIPRQLGCLLHQDYCKIADEFDDLAPGWRDRGGISANEIMSYAEHHDYTCLIFWQSKCIEKRQGTRRALSFSIMGGHAYFYKCYRRMLEKAGGVKEVRLKKETKLKAEITEPFEEVREGNFYHFDLSNLRIELLKQGYPVQAILSSPHCLKSLRIPLSKGVWCTVSTLPADHQELRDYVQRLSELTGLKLEYHNEGLPSLTFRLLKQLLREKRKHLTPAQRKALFDEQKGLCKECGSPLGGNSEADHVIPLCQSFEQSFQLLCVDCHRLKTNSESTHTDMLASTFNQDVFQQYVLSPHPKPYVFEAHEPIDNGLLLDIKKCRKNCLRECPYPIPIFSVVDTIVPCEKKLYDLAYIEKRCAWKTGQNVLSNMPYQAPGGWFTKPAQEFLLHYGICKWEHFKWGLDASGHLPKDNYLKDAIDALVEAWGDHENAKRCINCAVGLFHIDQDYCYSLRSCDEPQDEAMGNFFCKTQVEGLSITDYVYRTRLESGGVSYRHLSDWCLCLEAVRLSTAYRLILAAGCLPKQISQCCVDSILFTPSHKRRKRCLEIGEVTYKDLQKPKRLRPCGLTSTDSNAQPYRVEEVDKRLCGVYRLPQREPHKVVVQQRSWNLVNPHEAIGRNESCLIEGPPGSGKSWLAKQLLGDLVDQGKKVIVLAFTHVATLNMSNPRWPSATASHFCYKVQCGSPSYDYICVDEISMIPLSIWSILQRMCYLGTKWILLGDWQQFGCVSGHLHCGKRLPDDVIENSSFLKLMADNNKWVLNENKRSDQVLFDFYTSLIPGGSRYNEPLEDTLAWARQRFPVTDRIADVSLVISHAQRRAINRQMNRMLRTNNSTLLETSDGLVWLHENLRLIGHLDQKKNGCLNGAIYKVRSYTQNTVSLCCELTGKELEVSIDFVKKGMLRLAFARTQCSSQGTTQQGVCRIFTQHPKMTRRHLYVSVSRCTSSELLEIV
jgi:5-methylcytosine-specific restriction endonuclease McrA